VGIGVIAWTLATGATGLAGTFVILFLTRCLVGIGEAAYGPVAPTVISDLYPVEKRGSVMAIFYVAIPVGSALGYVLGGQVTHWASGDWRWAFFVVVPPGLLLGVWCFLMKDPPRGGADPGAVARKATWADYVAVLKTPSYLLTTLGMTAMTFAMGGMAFWMPRYGVHRQVPDLESRLGREATPDELATLLNEVNLYFGVIVVVSGLAATILGGIAGDRLKARFSGAYFLVSAIAMGLGFFFILGALWIPFPLAWLFIFLACFCLFFNTGPTNTILANVTHPSIRASAFALNILIIHALGDAISPPIIGLINGYTGDMTAGFLTVSVMCLVASILWFSGMGYLQRDTELAPTRMAS
jgi:MFS family permease